jgi:hypothetical protein
MTDLPDYEREHLLVKNLPPLPACIFAMMQLATSQTLRSALFQLKKTQTISAGRTVQPILIAAGLPKV